MAPPLRSTAEVPAPLAVADSERTLILQRRIGRIGMDNNKRRSAYFADSDASATSGGGGEPFSLSTLPQRAAAARIGATAVVPASGSTMAEGRWLLGGIRHSHGQLRGAQPQQQYRDANAFGNGLGRTAGTGNPTMSADGDEQKRDSTRGGAAVFYGSIRFPASRVALWNRRPTGSPVTITPESAAPILVLRQSAADAIASQLSSLAEGAHEGSPSAHFRWHGVLGSAADALHGRAASDPRAASTLSSAALEIVGLGDETSRSLRGVGVFAASDRAYGRRQGWPRRARAIALSGLLSATEEEEDGRGGGGLVLDEKYYRAVLDDCTKAIGGAKSASPEIFTPLRLQCSLKGHRAAASDGSRSRSRDGSEAPSRRPRRAQQASVQATLSLRGEMVVPGLGVRLTPIASPALLHTALYQSLLTRGADEKLQSGLLTLNEGRRAVLLSDDDPLSFRAHIVGVWVSGRTGDGSSSGDSGNGSGSGSGGPSTPGGQHHSHGRRPSLLGHPYTYPACLRFLLGPHRGNTGTGNGNGGGGGDGGGGASRPAATPASFLVLHLPGGVDGGPPAFFEACALSNGKAASATERRGLGVRSAGFEHLDFSADIDVTVGGGARDEGGEGGRGGGRGGGGRAGGEGGGGGGGDGRANRAVVIGRLRRVLKPSLAEPFGRALDEAMGRQRATPQLARDSYLRSSAPATPVTPAVAATPTATAAKVTELPSSQLQRHAWDQGARWHSRHHATAAGADNAEPPPPLDEPLDEPLAAPAPMAPPIKPTVVNAPSAALQSGQNGGVPASVGRVSVPTVAAAAAAAVAVVTPSPFQHHQGAGVNQHPFQTLGVRPIGESAVVGGGRGAGSTLFLDETFEGEGNKSTPIPRASGAGEGAGAGARSPLSPPPPPPLPLPPLDGGGQPDGASVPRHGSFDLLALDPAARVYFLAQQRQLSALEHQLRRLQATMHDRQQQPQPQPQQQQPQQLHSLPRQQSPLQPVRLSADHPFLSVSSSGPAPGIHAAAAAAAAAEAAEQVSADRQALPLSESRKETGPGELATDQAIEASATGTRVPMVEVGTNTSFLWGPAAAAVPPPPLSHGANKERRIGSDPSPPAATAVTTATAAAAAAALSRPAGARSLTASIAPRGHAASASPPAGNAVRNQPAQGGEVGGWELPPTERRSAHSSPASRSGESAAATSSGWTTQRGHAAEGDSPRRRRRRRDGREDGERGRGNERGGDMTGDSTCSSCEGDEEALERSPPLVLRLPAESSDVTSPHDRDRERWCHVPQRVVASSLARGGGKDKDDASARRGRQERRQGQCLSQDRPAAREARETAVKIGPSTSDDDGDWESDSTPEVEGGGENKPGVTIISPNRNMYNQGASRLPPQTTIRRIGDGGGSSGGGGSGTTERGKATGDRFENGGEILHRRWRPLVAGYRGNVDVVPVTIAELAVVPRIEFGHLTDDELGFDLDEGETICRIESKYLKGGSMARTRSKQQ